MKKFFSYYMLALSTVTCFSIPPRIHYSNFDNTDEWRREAFKNLAQQRRNILFEKQLKKKNELEDKIQTIISQQYEGFESLSFQERQKLLTEWDCVQHNETEIPATREVFFTRLALFVSQQQPLIQTPLLPQSEETDNPPTYLSISACYPPERSSSSNNLLGVLQNYIMDTPELFQLPEPPVYDGEFIPELLDR